MKLGIRGGKFAAVMKGDAATTALATAAVVAAPMAIGAAKITAMAALIETIPSLIGQP